LQYQFRVEERSRGECKPAHTSKSFHDSVVPDLYARDCAKGSILLQHLQVVSTDCSLRGCFIDGASMTLQ
jgi:hypothetical protein